MQAILSSQRDARIDVLRGLSLLMIFIDHIPGNKLGFATLHVFGFADAAEVFVLFAGFASMLAYGKAFLREGTIAGTRRVALRCLRIYATQVLLLMVTLVIVRVWTISFHQLPGLVAPLLDSPGTGVLHGLALHALPGYLDILPLYIVLLAIFPLIFVAMRWNLWAALAASGALWGLVHLDHAINLPNWLDANGWYFDPFSWQFMFVIGAALAVFMAGRGGAVPRRPWLTALCWVYLAGAFLETFPFDAYGLPSLRPFAMDTIDKTHLSFWRILDILAWVQIIFSAERTRAWAASRWARPLKACGRNSLDIFALGCLLALMARLLFRTFGRDWPMQVGVNVAGLVAMCLVALWLDQRARRRREAVAGWPKPAIP